MTFNSVSFCFFLPVVYLIFYVTADRWRWLVLLAASYCFYASFKAPYLLMVLALVTGVSYTCALRMSAHQEGARRKGWFWTGIVACAALLVLLKYFSFLVSGTEAVIGLAGMFPRTLISVGVSYYTFQAMSYLIDVYLDLEQPETHLGIYSLHLGFFPKLLQGPIERAGDLLPQLREPFRFDYQAARTGLLLFMVGMFKKVVIADRLALFVNPVYGDVQAHSALQILIATYLYALQILFDFSGYTDMALGTAKIFNINLTPNFDKPYSANSVADFWRRWHISFSRWMLDYIFKPVNLKLRNFRTTGTVIALLVTFLFSGIWHGVGWGFVAWGLLHGLYLSVGVVKQPYVRKIHKRFGLEKTAILALWQRFATFHLVCFAWIFFRARSAEDAVGAVAKIASGTMAELHGIIASATRSAELKELVKPLLLGQSKHQILIGVGALLFITLYQHMLPLMNSKPAICRWLCYYALLGGVLFLGAFNTGTQFIYVQF
jgi:D-alanyl-lipoteichoic acid acyltransferase DltB (MBOAT superfamily)